MTVYLSGPMTGIKDFNRKGFAEAEDVLREHFGDKIAVVNPWKLGKALEDIFQKDGRGKPGYYDYLRYDVQWLAQSDAVLLLPGFKKSNGVEIEMDVAGRLCIPAVRSIPELETFMKMTK